MLTPFAAFLLAQSFDTSGVVAVLVAGLVLSRAGPRVIRARSRLQAFAFWDLATFLINGSLFVFVGVQIPGAVHGISHVGAGLGHAAVVALAITGVVVGTRMAWMEITTVLIRAVDRREVQRTRRASWRQRCVVSWSGFRGAVSLAAALAVPTAAFPDRNLIVFVTSVVIVLTVLVQGSTLPLVVAWARLPEDTARAEELELARRCSAEAALNALPAVATQLGMDEQLLNRLRREYEERAAVVQASGHDSENTARDKHDLVRRARLGVLEHKRQAVIALRDQNRIDDIVLRELQSALDIEEVRLLGPAGTD